MHSLTLPRFRFSVWAKVLGVATMTVLTAASARVTVLLPFSPVPLTLQVLTVILSGFLLGWRGALASQVLYLQAILLGAPWTAAGLGGPAAFLAPTAGYLLAFPLAAALAGWVGERAPGRAIVRLLGGLSALAIIYALGTMWLAGFVGGLANGWRLGAMPFIAADVLKIVIASSVLALRRR